MTLAKRSGSGTRTGLTSSSSRRPAACSAYEVLPKRFGRFGLTIHPDKTRLVPFQRPAPGRGGAANTAVPPERARPGTFDFLGFTHDWGKSLRGNWVVKRKTARSRFQRTLRGLSDWCRRHRHEPVEVQQQVLNSKLQGHDSYYGLTGNARWLKRLRYEVQRIWRNWLNRRHRERTLTWDQFEQLIANHPLLPARVVHSVYGRRR